MYIHLSKILLWIKKPFLFIYGKTFQCGQNSVCFLLLVSNKVSALVSHHSFSCILGIIYPVQIFCVALVSMKTIWINVKIYPLSLKVIGALSADNKRLLHKLHKFTIMSIEYYTRDMVSFTLLIKRPSKFWLWTSVASDIFEARLLRLLFFPRSQRTTQFDFH